jgi:Na+-transporting NADH:ubiquinone oxidoreductase subunit NqrF
MKHSNCRIGISSVATIVIAVVVVAVAGVVAYAYIPTIPIHQTTNYGCCSTSTISSETSIVGNDITESVAISVNTGVDLTCNSCSITFNVNSGSTLTINVVGNSNQVTINGGSTNIEGTGNYNIFYASDTHVSSNSLTGNDNSVQ